MRRKCGFGDSCGKDAIDFIVLVINDQEQKLYLCAEHYDAVDTGENDDGLSLKGVL